jgi:cyclophilin family peptidyl-prolyl cis-trans isomerase
MKNSTVLISISIILIVSTIIFFIYTSQSNSKKENTTNSKTTTSQTKTMNKPELTINKDKSYTAILKTEVGDIEIALTADKTPITVNNFVYLAREKFYDNVVFHRTRSDFMIQGGDPTGTGSGGPGYKFNDEPFTGEYTRGTVAMANSGPNTNGSQFFIMTVDMPIAKSYVIFGKVVSGLDVVDKIAAAPAVMNSMGEKAKPITPIKILSVEIIEK